jgi:hypothetical protein
MLMDHDDEVVLVCMRLPDVSGYPDNLTGLCAACRRGIYHRPRTPPAAVKLCVQCAIAELTGERGRSP